MKLKRVPRRAAAPPPPPPSSTGGGGKQQGGPGGAAGAAGGPAGAAEHDAFISRLTSGMSFDFSSRDERIYIAGACRVPAPLTPLRSAPSLLAL